VSVPLPAHAKWLVAFGENVPRLRRGTVIATIEPGGIPVRIGDIVDWGSMRRAQFWRAKNIVPRHPAGVIRDYGYEAWADGAARIALPSGVSSIRITALPALPPDARLQLIAVETEP
jgi:hypothetical protein